MESDDIKMAYFKLMHIMHLRYSTDAVPPTFTVAHFVFPGTPVPCCSLHDTPTSPYHRLTTSYRVIDILSTGLHYEEPSIYDCSLNYYEQN